MKVQKVTLKEIEVVEVDGEFEQRFINSKTYPAFLTNAAIKKGYDSGILQSSLFTDLLQMRSLEKAINNEDEGTASESLATFDESKMIDVVYLAFMGANKNTEMSYEEFLDRYHYDLTETIELYANLITDLVASDNGFVKGLAKSTKREKKSTKLQS